MDLLLDTHALFWSIYDTASLSQEAEAALADGANRAWVTLTSAQEIAIKIGVGRWPAAVDLLLNFELRLRDAGFGLIAPTAVDYANQLRLPEIGGHSDPFDKLIIAQALARSMVLVTSDPRAPAYGVQCVFAGRGQREGARGARSLPIGPLTPLPLPKGDVE